MPKPKLYSIEKHVPLPLRKRSPQPAVLVEGARAGEGDPVPFYHYSTNHHLQHFGIPVEVDLSQCMHEGYSLNILPTYSE